jgi:hypothetical protein
MTEVGRAPPQPTSLPTQAAPPPRYLANADSDVLTGGSGSNPEHPSGSTGSRGLQERRGEEAGRAVVLLGAAV